MADEVLHYTRSEDLNKKWSRRMRSIYAEQLAVTHRLQVRGEEYPVNAAVIHAALPTIPADQWDACFSQVHAAVLPELLRYLYSCQVTVSMATLQHMMRAAKVLQLAHLHTTCEQYLFEHLCPENCVGWYGFMVEQGCEEAAKRCRDAIAQQLDKVRQCREFQQLSLEEVRELIQQQPREDADRQFHAVLSWVSVKEERYEHVEHLIDLIDLTKCSGACLEISTEDQYEKVFWSRTLQNKLLRAAIRNTGSSSSMQAEYNNDYQPCEDVTTDKKDQTMDLTIESNADFARHMMASFQNFAKDETNFDIVLLVNSPLKAHQVVLAVSSLYFLTLLRAKSKEVGVSQTSPLETSLVHLDSPAVTALVEFMYTGVIIITDLEMLQHLEACDYLRLEPLLETCRRRAERGVEIVADNCFEWLSASKLFSLPNTQQRATTFICESMASVYRMDGLLSLGYEDLLELLNHEALVPLLEKTFFDLIILWISQQHEERKQHLSGLLESKGFKCTTSEVLDVPDVLSASRFDAAEREMFWAAHFKRTTMEWQDYHMQEVTAVEAKLDCAAKEKRQLQWLLAKAKKREESLKQELTDAREHLKCKKYKIRALKRKVETSDKPKHGSDQMVILKYKKKKH